MINTPAAIKPAKYTAPSPAIAPTTPPLLARLGMNAEAFIASADHFFKDFAGAVGTPAKLIELSAQRQQRCLRGLAAARRVFETKAA